MPTPEQVDAFTKLGFAGALVIAVVALWKRVVIFRAEKVEADASADARLAEMRIDRDEWKNVARAAQGRNSAMIDTLHKSLERSEKLTITIESMAARVDEVATRLAHATSSVTTNGDIEHRLADLERRQAE